MSILSSITFDHIIEGYKKDLIGREFVYLSEYGSTTFGVVKDVILRINHNFDDETSRRMKVGIAAMSTKVNIDESDLVEKIVDRRWSGTFPYISIISETGNVYNLESDKLFFLGEKNSFFFEENIEKDRIE